MFYWIKSILFVFLPVLVTSAAMAKVYNVSDSSIIISWANVSTLKFLKIAIYKNGAQATIIYSIGTGMDRVGLVNDTAYAEADRQQKASRLAPMVALYDKYRIYLSDTVKVIDELLNKKFARVASSTKGELVPPGANDRGVLDGAWIDFDIATRGGKKNVTAESPLPNTHPILYDLLKQVAHIYRQSETRGYLNKEARFY
jgi:hypothetical protein